MFEVLEHVTEKFPRSFVPSICQKLHGIPFYKIITYIHLHQNIRTTEKLRRMVDFTPPDYSRSSNNAVSRYSTYESRYSVNTLYQI